MDEIEAKLKALNLKYPSQNPSAVKLYLHVGGYTPNSKWIVSDKVTSYSFIKTPKIEESEGKEENDDEEEKDAWWVLKIGSKVRVRVSAEMQLKTLLDQLRVDLVWKGVWAMKFFNEEGYRSFVTKYQECLFENTYGVEFNDANKVKVYGKEFIVWANPDKADDSVWEDAEDSFVKSPNLATLVRETHDLREEFEEAANEADDSVWEDAEDSFFIHMFSAHFRLRLLMNRCKRGGYMTSLMSLKELALLKRSSRTKSTGTTAVYRNRISPDPIFLTSEASSAGGFYAINRRGQVLLATVNESTIVPFVSGQLNNLELAVNLAKRGNLPGAEIFLL